MAEKSEEVFVDPKKVVFILGAFIFGGLLLVSFIHASFYAEKYSSAFLWQFRGTIACAAIIYFALTFVLNRKS